MDPVHEKREYLGDGRDDRKSSVIAEGAAVYGDYGAVEELGYVKRA